MQNHHDPYSQDREVLSFCRKHNIQFTAYSSLNKAAMNHAVVQDLAQKYHRTPSQIILKWLTQQDIVVLPRSTSLNHIVRRALISPNFIISNTALQRDNINIFGFTLEEEDMNAMQQLRV